MERKQRTVFILLLATGFMGTVLLSMISYGYRYEANDGSQQNMLVLLKTMHQNQLIEFDPINYRKIHIHGAVHAPGTYFLNLHATLAHAICKAGGLHPQADVEKIGNNRLLRHNQKINIPYIMKVTIPNNEKWGSYGSKTTDPFRIK
jgi:hypothetical protein